MGMFDKAKDLVNENVDKAKKLIDENAEKIDGAVDKAAKFADDKTGGKYSDKIQKGAEAIKDRTGEADGGAHGGPTGGPTGGPGTPGPA